MLLKTLWIKLTFLKMHIFWVFSRYWYFSHSKEKFCHKILHHFFHFLALLFIYTASFFSNATKYISWNMTHTTFLKEVAESLGSALLYVSKEGVRKVAPYLLGNIFQLALWLTYPLSNALCYNSVKFCSIFQTYGRNENLMKRSFSCNHLRLLKSS